jgi:hydrogenase nickel incorporation protein HypB
VLSVPEGADKPLKYPMLFSQAKAIVLTKTDLLPYVSFDSEMFERDVRSLNPDAPVFSLNLKSGEGVAEWVSFIAERLKGKNKNA